MVLELDDFVEIAAICAEEKQNTNLPLAPVRVIDFLWLSAIAHASGQDAYTRNVLVRQHYEARKSDENNDQKPQHERHHVKISNAAA